MCGEYPMQPFQEMCVDNLILIEYRLRVSQTDKSFPCMSVICPSVM